MRKRITQITIYSTNETPGTYIMIGRTDDFGKNTFNRYAVMVSSRLWNLQYGVLSEIVPKIALEARGIYLYYYIHR